MSEAACIRAEELSKSYIAGESEVRALSKITLSVARGEFLALRGSSGSGKSTLLNLLAGLVRPSEGRIWIAGHELREMTDAELSKFRAGKIGFIFQNFNLLPVLTARENVEYGLINLGLKPAERARAATQALREVGLESCAGRLPAQLSGGQRQRVAVARAFARRPELIIADEPTASLDRLNAAGILDLMSHMNRRTGATIVMATHDEFAVARAARVVEICDGRLK